jgi:hypothetical protein
MKKIGYKAESILHKVSNLEKKHKIITYLSLLFLTTSTYFLRTENQQIKLDYITIKERNQHLKENMIIFNRNYENFPQPIWQKVKRGNRFIIQYINPAYVKEFGHTFKDDIYQVIGKDNFDIWPKKTAQIFYENDVAVSVTGIELEIEEDFVDKNNKPTILDVVKWRSIRDNKDTLVYGMVRGIREKK